MTVEVKNGRLLISVELDADPKPSKSGKNLVVATTHGNAATAATHKGKPITLGLNAYIKA